MIFEKMFPTKFAVAVAKSCGLVRETQEFGKNAEMFEDHERLEFFQQMIIGGVDAEDAMIVYHGIELNKVQKDALTLIAEATRPFLLGKLAQVLVDKSEKGNSSAIGTLLTEIINRDDKGPMSGDEANSLLLKFTR